MLKINKIKPLRIIWELSKNKDLLANLSMALKKFISLNYP